MAKRQRKHQPHAQENAAPSQQGEAVESVAVESVERQQAMAAASRQPTVTLCTVTYNRSAFLPLLQRHILSQTYPRHLMEWVLVDDSDDGQPAFEPDHGQGLKIIHKRLDRHLPLGEKRNLSHSLCKGEIIVYLDDDDYYPPTRVAHAVERLLGSDALIAGSTILPILFLPERELWVAGPYGPKHATAGTFAFKRQLLDQARYDDEKTFAEEKSFLKDYSLPMVQLDCNHTIVCIGHDRNTFEKRNLISGGKNPRFRKINPEATEKFLNQLKPLLPSYEKLLLPSSKSGKPAEQQPADITSQLPGIRVTRLPQPVRSHEQVVPPFPAESSSVPSALDEVNICIISHPGDLFSLCFIDVARYLRYRLRLINGSTKIHLSKNRLYKDVVNIVLGAHVGFEPSLRLSYKCIFVNLEQLGQTGKRVRPEYLELLRTSAVIDYDPSNLDHYRDGNRDDVAMISFGYAPYLQTVGHLQSPFKPLQQREIDLLFYGSMNESRRELLQRLARHGGDVKVLNNLFGPERDEVVRNAKLVLNLSYYEKGTFEQVRAFHCLSLGTPMLSVLSENTANIPSHYHDSVFFFTPGEACSFLESTFNTEAFYAEAQSRLAAFRSGVKMNMDDEQSQLRRLLAAVGARHVAAPSERPKKVNLGSGKKYMQGWINIDTSKAVNPDLVLDLSQDLPWPLLGHSKALGTVQIDEGSVDFILADNVLEHVPDLPQLMSNCLRMLKVDGKMEIIVPYEKRPVAWQDPTHVRAFNENSWIYYTQWCWYLGWFHHHFHLESLSYLDGNARLAVKTSEEAWFMKVQLTKVKSTPAELNSYRLLAADFGPDLDDHEF